MMRLLHPLWKMEKEDMTKHECRWLLYSAGLAVGEGVAAYFSRGASAWPVALIVMLLIVLFGYGYRVRGWTYFALAALGIALSFHASLDREEQLRQSPWLRDRPGGTMSAGSSFVFARAVRTDLSTRVGLGLDATRETVTLNRAILLGERSNLSKSTKQIFIDSGTIHVFAISGLHVMIVARLFMFIVALFFVPLYLQGIVTLPLVWGYVLLVGAPPSAIRAAVMASFYFLAPVFDRRPNGLVAWALAFLSVHLINPLQIADVGSQLSFAVMLALVFASRLSRTAFSRWGSWLFVSFAAWAAGVPIAAATFGRVTPGGLLANLMLLFAAFYSVIAGALGVLVSYFSSRLAIHCNNFAALCTDAMVVISKSVARLPGANFETQSWNFIECAIWYMALGLVLFAFYRLHKPRNLV